MKEPLRPPVYKINPSKKWQISNLQSKILTFTLHIFIYELLYSPRSNKYLASNGNDPRNIKNLPAILNFQDVIIERRFAFQLPLVTKHFHQVVFKICIL